MRRTIDARLTKAETRAGLTPSMSTILFDLSIPGDLERQLAAAPPGIRKFILPQRSPSIEAWQSWVDRDEAERARQARDPALQRLIDRLNPTDQ